MGETKGGTSASLFFALRSIAATLLASGRTRLELFANEVEAEKLRATLLALVVFAMAFCFGLGIVLAVILLALLFQEQRLAVLTVCALVFFALGATLLLRLKRELRRPGQIFAASMAELERDLHRLNTMAGHDESPDR
jgi:uncharacterized membrane protein YqjE